MSELHESKQCVEPRKVSDIPGGAGGILNEARKLVPLDQLMARYGFVCPLEKRSGFTCPFCAKRKASLREYKDRLWFKCFNPECPSGTFSPHSAFDEVGFIGFKLGLSHTNGRPGHYSDAAIAFMKEAGVWRESCAESGKAVAYTRAVPNRKPSADESAPSVGLPQSMLLADEPSPLTHAVEQLGTSDFAGETGYEALVEFFAGLKLSEEDERILFEKRGLTSATVAALQFRSNPRSNQAIIEQMVASRGWCEMIASGLALPADPQRKLENRVNMQFCGKGQAGKIPKALRKQPNIKATWDWNQPILIPYFDAAGNLVGLRPHKGGAPAETVAGNKSLYIPRAFEPPFAGPERFTKVVITEGEFKAAALWQTVGIGARQFLNENKRPLFDTEAYGVCALPGISYARHIETRTMLEEWLQLVGCRQVIVAFDYEVKWDPSLPSYQEDPECRYDTLIYAFYLATYLSQELHLGSRVCVLPKAWINAAGKADWDSALASVVHAGALQ